MESAVSKDNVVAFRLRAHHLDERLGENGILAAAGRCGIQNSPPGSALLALYARVQNLTQERVEAQVAEEKSLLQTWCMRGSPFYIPSVDAAVFTTGVLPPTDDALRHFLPGVAQTLGELDMTIAEAVELTGAELRGVLSGRRLTITDLGAELATRIARRLPRSQRDPWEAVGPYAPDQPLGEGIVHFCIRILTLQQAVCLAPRVGNKAPFVLIDEWFGQPLPSVDAEGPRAELLRRYLRSYGPSTRADFAAWVGISAGDTDPWWSLIEDELAPVGYRGTSWILSEDLPTLCTASVPQGVRLLPPRDPYTQMRDRDAIVDPAFHREIWKTIGEPGAVLVNGRITGTWRPRKSGRKLTITITAFDRPSNRQKTLLQDEAEQIAPLRGASSVDVVFDRY